MINSYFESIQKIIRNEPLIICTNLNQNYTSVNTAYIKGELTFADGSKLVLFQHIRIHGTELVMTDYRYHYMTDDNELIFRYDNAPIILKLPLVLIINIYPQEFIMLICQI